MFPIRKALLAASSMQLRRNVFPAFKETARYSSVTTWNKDWKPGPYPRTKEERIAAAKKYNMLPEDYEPYPEEEGFGDYPKFEPVHMELRNPFEVYDFHSLKRNYGEPIHPDFDMQLEDKINFQKEMRIPLWKQYLYLGSFVTLISSIVVYEALYPPDIGVIPKQYPDSGVKHYTFEP
ncbi:NADH dehydrogenase [ubiquinone] 1 beta subcomplex subunit 8, mitochondrial, partial [Stegodyphus mimosarum]